MNTNKNGASDPDGTRHCRSYQSSAPCQGVKVDFNFGIRCAFPVCLVRFAHFLCLFPSDQSRINLDRCRDLLNARPLSFRNLRISVKSVYFPFVGVQGTDSATEK